jgi:hypothetical protein
MTFGAYILPSAHVSRNDDIDRYVRTEYREDSSSWLTANNGRGNGLKLPADAARKQSHEEEMHCSQPRRAETRTCCPVLNAVSKGTLTAGISTRGDRTGNP